MHLPESESTLSSSANIYTAGKVYCVYSKER